MPDNLPNHSLIKQQVEVSLDAVSRGSFWSFVAEVKYEIKDAGEHDAKFFLTRLPSAKPKTVAWSSFRHETKVFYAKDKSAAMLKFNPIALLGDEFLHNSFPAIKNAKIVRITIRLFRFDSAELSEFDVAIPQPEPKVKVKKIKEL